MSEDIRAKVIEKKVEAIGKEFNIDREAMEDRAEQVLSKVAETGKVGMFKGIQTRIMSLVITAVVITAACFLISGIGTFKSALTDTVKHSMLSLAQAYGAELNVVERANNGELPSGEELIELFGSVDVDGIEGGYCYIVDETGTMIMHPDSSRIGSKVENVVVSGLVEELKAGKIPEAAVVDYDYRGAVKLASYYVLPDGKAILVVTADESAALLPISNFILQCVIVTVIVLVLASVIGTVMSRTIVRPIKMLTNVVNQNANYDFTESRAIRVLSKGKGETAIMSRSLGILRSNLVHMVEQLADTADRLSNNADGLKGIVEDLNSNSCDNSATSQELAASMEETSATTQLIDERMADVNENAKQIGQLTMEGERSAEDIIVKAESLKKSSEEANAKTREIYSRVKQESDIAIEKAKEINQINELTEAIASIASQTNLLSLNASIEAARAGDAGRGFAVVAGEIGNLATQSTQTANSITAIVGSVKDAAESMEQCLRQMIAFMEETVIRDYDNFIRVSEEYSADAREFSGSMKTINTSITDLEENISNIANSIQGINETVTEVAISINDIASKASDMVGYAADTGQKAEDNAEFARQMEEIVKQFKI